MAIYMYRCTECSHYEEHSMPITDPNPAVIVCEECGSESKKVWTPNPVHFIGGGFYSTENRRP